MIPYAPLLVSLECIPIIAACDGSESILSSSVPLNTSIGIAYNLQLHIMLPNLQCFRLEIDSNGIVEVVGELIFRESHKHAGLADSRVSDE